MSTGQRMIGGGVKVSPLRFKRWMPICSCANWVAGSYDGTCPGIEVRTSLRRDWPVAVFSSLAMRSCRVCLALIIGHPRRAQAGLTLSPARELAGPAVIAVKAALAPQRSEERRVGKACRCGGSREASSRRRHTRWPRDWSSDVCSSDLTSLRRDWPVAVFSSLAMRSCRVCLALIIGHPRRAQAGLTLSPARELAGPAVIAVKAALAPQGLNHVQAVANGALFFRQLGLINSAKIDRGGLGPDTHSVADDDARVELHFEISAQ